MKITMTKKEVKGYMDLFETVLIPVVGDEEFLVLKETFIAQIKNGVKSGAVKFGLNKKMNLVYEIDQNYVAKLLSMYSKYLVVAIPQVMSIINLTKNLMDEYVDLLGEFDNNEE